MCIYINSVVACRWGVEIKTGGTGTGGKGRHISKRAIRWPRMFGENVHRRRTFFFTLSYRSKMNPAIKYTRSGNKNRFFLLTGQQGPKYSKKAISRRKR